VISYFNEHYNNVYGIQKNIQKIKGGLKVAKPQVTCGKIIRISICLKKIKVIVVDQRSKKGNKMY
jgi:hypothetical protein